MILKSNRGNKQILGNINMTESQTISLIYKNSREAFELWKNTDITQRLIYIGQFLDIYKSKRNEIATSISMEIGKPITQSLADVNYDIGYIEWFLANAENILMDEIIYEDQKSKHIVKHDPIGVMAVISPWNYPTSQRIREVIPTLIAGNTVIYKCSSSCMRTANILNQILEGVLPKGIFGYIYGSSELGDELIKGDCDGIIFTGSTKVGQHIAEVATEGFKKTFLELGGSAPAVICEDAVIDHDMMRSFDYYRRRHGGQICDGIKRVIIHSSKFDEFMTKMSAHLNAKYIGNPLDPQTDIGPLVSDKQLQTLQSQIDDAVSKGAKLHQFGKYDNTPGPYILPTLLTNISLDMRIMTEETFGPILPIYIYDSIEDAIKIANSTIYGLGGYIWGELKPKVETFRGNVGNEDNQKTDTNKSENSNNIYKLINGLNTGNISANNANYLIPQVPFGGYTASSGNTRAHGKIGLRELCKVKTISLAK